MKLSSLDQRKQKLLVLGTPSAVLLLSLVLLVPAWSSHSATHRKLEKRRAELADLLKTLPKPDRTRQILVSNAPVEPTAFVRDITSIARDAGCRFSGLNVTDTGEAAKPEVRVVPGGPLAARAVSAEVLLIGEYRSVRRFLAGLARAKRLYVVTGTALRMQGVDPDKPTTALVQASITVERYVAEPLRATKGRAPEKPSAPNFFSDE